MLYVSIRFATVIREQIEVARAADRERWVKHVRVAYRVRQSILLETAVMSYSVRRGSDSSAQPEISGFPGWLYTQ